MQSSSEMTPEEYPIIAMECHRKYPQATLYLYDSMQLDSPAPSEAASPAVCTEPDEPESKQQQQQSPQIEVPNSSKDTSESLYEITETLAVWPPDCKVVPADYDVAAANAPVFRDRAERVMNLGNYWAIQGHASMSTELINSELSTEKGALGVPYAPAAVVGNKIEKGDLHARQAAARELASKAGGYQQLAKLGRESLQRENSERIIIHIERRNSSAQSCFKLL